MSVSISRDDIILLCTGFIAGFFSSLFGVGGGIIMVPALVLLIHFDVKKAIGTSLATMILMTLVGVITHYIVNSANIKLGIVLCISIGTLFGARLGAWLTHKLSSGVLSKIFAVMLAISGLKLAGILNFPTNPVSDVVLLRVPLLIGLGLFAGIASALLGIGGGIIMVPILTMFFKLDMHEAVATSLTVILPTSLAGAIFHHKFNNIEMPALRFLVPTALVGAALGAITANALPADRLKLYFGIFMIITSLRMLFQKPKK